MAFTPETLSEVFQTIGGTFRCFYYASDDTLTTILTPGYFVHAQRDYGVKNAGDMIEVYSSADGAHYTLNVTAFDSVGTATVEAEGGVGVRQISPYFFAGFARDTDIFQFGSPAATGEDDLFGSVAPSPKTSWGSPRNFSLRTPGGEAVPTCAFLGESGFFHALSLKICDNRGDAPEIAIDRVKGISPEGVSTFQGIVFNDGLGSLYWRGLDNTGRLDATGSPYGRTARLTVLATETFTPTARGGCFIIDVCKNGAADATTWGWISQSHYFCIRAGNNSPDPGASAGDATIHMFGQGIGGVNFISGALSPIDSSGVQVTRTGAGALSLNRTDTGGILLFYLNSVLKNYLGVNNAGTNIGWLGTTATFSAGYYSNQLLNVADDGFSTITPPSSMGTLIIDDGTGRSALFSFRTDNTTGTLLLAGDAAVWAAGNTDLTTGTSDGTDGKHNIFGHSGVVFVKNRSGNAINYTYTILDK